MRRLVLLVLALAALPATAEAAIGFGTPEPVDPFFATEDTFTGRQLQVDASGRALFVSHEDVVVDAEEGTTDRQVVVYERCGTTWQVSDRLGNVHSGGVETIASTLAMTPAGDAVVIWTEGNAYLQTIYASFRAAGGAWSAPEAIDTLDIAGSVMSDIAPNGDVAIAYRERTFPTSALRVAVRPKSTGTWVKETLNQVGAVRAVAMTPTADAVVLVSTGSAPAQLASLYRPAGGSWDAPQAIGEIASTIAPTRIVGLPDGQVLLVVGELDSAGNKDRVRHATRALGTGGAWSALTDLTGSQVADSDGGIIDLELVRHPSGALAAWVKRDTAAFDEDAAVARYVGGAGFETPQTYSLDGRFVSVAAATDAAGRSLLAAHHSGASERIRVAVAEAGEAWPTQTDLLSPDSGDRRGPVAAGDGILAVGWGVHSGSNATSEAVADGPSPACSDPDPDPDPGTPDPGTPDPGTPDPGTPDPGTPDPGSPAPPPGGAPPPPAAPDAIAPRARLSKLRFSRGRVRFVLALDEAARVTITLDGRRVAVRRLAAGRHKLAVKPRRRLRHGKHRLALKAVDAAGNAAPAVKARFRR